MSRKIDCPDCGYGFYSSEGLERHRQKRHVKCPLCPRSYIRVERHMALSHYWPIIRADVDVPA